MANQTALLRSYCERLGISPFVADIYYALRAHGPQTISELARNVGMERIRIYRMLDELRDSGLIEIETAYKRSILRAAPTDNLELLLIKRKQQLRDLQEDYLSLRAGLDAQNHVSSTTSVRFYKGLEGLKQMLWNQTKGKGERLTILSDNIQHKAGSAFFERWVRQCNRRGLSSRGIVSDHFIETQQKWYATHHNERVNNWQARYVSDDFFPIRYNLVIYDDVVIHYDWKNDESTFGIEIHSRPVAQLQRQLFELLWQKGQPIDI
jgi:sugar-specific transcriptional regulator TrmB